MKSKVWPFVLFSVLVLGSSVFFAFMDCGNSVCKDEHLPKTTIQGQNPVEQERSPKSNVNTFAYSEDLLKEKLKEGRSVFLVVTADWCRYCIANKQFIEDARFLKFLSDNKVDIIIVDVSKSHPSTDKFMQDNKVVGIPYYVIYYNGSKTVLPPEIESTENLIDNCRRALK